MSIADRDAGPDQHTATNAVELRVEEIEQFPKGRAVALLSIIDAHSNDSIGYGFRKRAASQSDLVHTAGQGFVVGTRPIAQRGENCVHLGAYPMSASSLGRACVL